VSTAKVRPFARTGCMTHECDSWCTDAVRCVTLWRGPTRQAARQSSLPLPCTTAACS
jgi:hypothetical protein